MNVPVNQENIKIEMSMQPRGLEVENVLKPFVSIDHVVA